jgi:hypothetical protein
MRRREFMTLLGGAVVWPLAAGARLDGFISRNEHRAQIVRSALTYEVCAGVFLPCRHRKR